MNEAKIYKAVIALMFRFLLFLLVLRFFYDLPVDEVAVIVDSERRGGEGFRDTDGCTVSRLPVLSRSACTRAIRS